MNEDLQHHGILGMKWGVRRFQNYDGSYTKRGLERYNQSESAYDNARDRYKHAKASYKLGDITKREVQVSKKQMQNAKINLSRSYEGLKREHTIDRGRDLRSQGKTIIGNKLRTAAVATAFGATAYAAHNVLRNAGYSISTKYGSLMVGHLAPAAIATGGAIVTGILNGKDKREARKLRAYYTAAKESKKGT